MDRSNFNVAIGPNQHEMSQVRLREHILQQLERRGVYPLQIVQEESQWVFRSRKCLNEPSKYELKTALCVP